MNASPLAVVISSDLVMSPERLAKLKREAWRRFRIAIIKADEIGDEHERATVERIAERQFR